MYLLDTNTLIYFFKGLGHIPERMLASAPGEIVLPSITVYEIETGIAKSKQPEMLRKDLDDLLSMVNVLPFGMPKPGQQTGSGHISKLQAHLKITAPRAIAN